MVKGKTKRSSADRSRARLKSVFNQFHDRLSRKRAKRAHSRFIPIGSRDFAESERLANLPLRNQVYRFPRDISGATFVLHENRVYTEKNSHSKCTIINRKDQAEDGERRKRVDREGGENIRD